MSDILTNIWNRNIEIYRILLFLIIAALIVYILPKERKFTLSYQKGKPWLHENLIAPFDFPILKTPENLNIEKQNVINNITPYFNFDSNIFEQKKKQLINEFNFSWKDSFIFNKEYNLKVCLNIYDVLLSKGIIEINDLIDEKPEDFTIILIKNNVAEERELKDFFTIKSAKDYIKRELINVSGADVKFIADLLQDFLVQNVVYNAETTEKEKNMQLESISPSRGMIQRGQNIISKGDIVTDEKFNVLESFTIEYSAQTGTAKRFAIILLGQIFYVAIALSMLLLFLYYFRHSIFNDNKKILLNLILIFLIVFFTTIVVRYKPHMIYILPICIVPIIARAFFDSKLALFILLVSLIITALIVPDTYQFIILQLITGFVTIVSISKLQNRSQFFITSVFIFLTYSLTYTSMFMLFEGSFDNLKTTNYAWFAANALLTLFSYPLIFLFEKLFGFITDVSLMELSGTYAPMLRELSAKAPGTFQHSLQVANLAEEAIYHIGGNPLLVRTGALYHDIGKIDNPRYFIENQVGDANPHNELPYDESANIIIGHVINGIHKAKSYKIPEQVIDFIRTHHGTTKTRYFYSAYLKNLPEDEPVDESMFTYHGPIPFSKETGVVMMADAVEASSRSLKRYDEDAINNLVESIIHNQILENQLVNSDITLKDINTIKKIFKRRLMNMYHLRIQYPE